jgi:hypothetical protein
MSRRLRLTRNESGWLALVPLPLGFGLNIGPGFSGYISLRSWTWARYDHADHMGEQTRWATQVLINITAAPNDNKLADRWERYTAARDAKRWEAMK